METTPTAPSNQVSAGQSGSPSQKPASNEEEKPDIDSLTTEQIEAIESGDQERIAAAFEGVEPPQPNGDDPQNKDEPSNQDPGEAAPTRISLKAIKNEEERLALVNATAAVREGKYLTLAEALGADPYFASRLPAAPPKADPEPPSEPDNSLESVETQIKDLREQRAAARKEFDYEKVDELTDQIEDLTATRSRALIEQAETQRSEQAVEVQVDASRQRAFEKYAEQLTDPESEFADFVQAEIFLADKKGDGIFDQPDWPEKIADRVNEKYYRAAKSAPETAQVPPAPKQSGIRLAGSPAPGSADSKGFTPSTAFAQLNQLSSEEAEKLLAALDS